MTTDFLICTAEIELQSGFITALPIDALSTGVAAQVSRETLVLSAVLAVAGDTRDYVAPALAIVDENLFRSDAARALRLARIFAARRGTAASGGMRVSLDDGKPTAVAPWKKCMPGHARIQLCGPPTAPSATASVSLLVTGVPPLQLTCSLVELVP